MTVSPVCRAACLLLLFMRVEQTWADERRAPPPKFADKDLNAAFFEDLSEAFRGQRPTLSSVRRSTAAAVASAASADTRRHRPKVLPPTAGRR